MLGDMTHVKLPDGLHDFLDALQKDLNGIAALIGTMFFRDWRPLLGQEQVRGEMSMAMGGMSMTMGANGQSQTMK